MDDNSTDTHTNFRMNNMFIVHMMNVIEQCVGLEQYVFAQLIIDTLSRSHQARAFFSHSHSLAVWSNV